MRKATNLGLLAGLLMVPAASLAATEGLVHDADRCLTILNGGSQFRANG